MNEGVETVNMDAMELFQWSWNAVVGNSRIWIYPVAVSFIQGLVSAAISIYAYLLGFGVFLLLPLLSAIQFLLNLLFTVAIFFLVLISVKMFTHLYEGREPDFESAKDDILRSPIEYIIIGILAAILSIFIITIPVALLLIVTSVLLGPSDIGKAFSITLSILEKNLANIILLSLVAIILGLIAIAISSLYVMSGFLSIFISPLTTFIDILILGAFTYLALHALGYPYGSASSSEM